MRSKINGAESVASTMYEAVTGNPMPSTKEARATRSSVINSEPCAHSTIIRENALPTPVVVTTLITIPTATSSRAVDTMLRTPSTTASKMSCSFIGVVESQDAAITDRIAKAAEEVGVRPEMRSPIKTLSGMIKCQPSFNTVRTDSPSPSCTGVIPSRFASIRTK